MARLFSGAYEEELTKKDIAEWKKKAEAGLIVDDVPGGTDVSVPIRVDYMNGDYHKAFDLLKSKKIPIKYKTVMTVPPFHATIHIFPNFGVQAMETLAKAKIKMYKAKPVF
jgi:hypothetical protein